VCENGRVEVGVREERVLIVVFVAPGEVSSGQALEPIRLRDRCEMASGIGQKLELIIENMRIPGQNDTVGERRKGANKCVGELRAPAMADMEDFLRLWDIGKFSVSRSCRQGCEEGELIGGLHFGVWVCEG
jgi:hypothetical protein